MTLTFRNLDVSPDDPVENWPTEAVLTALERGGLGQWRRLAAAIRADPWGPVAGRVEEALSVTRPYGVSELMETVVASAREKSHGFRPLPPRGSSVTNTQINRLRQDDE
ncbi:MAG: hypothetical protein L0I76_06810 [Pseudonocardia sp.]|nr:hypothetical protein [Pseudonocardia sp.]